jgi:hypothetical protein
MRKQKQKYSGKILSLLENSKLSLRILLEDNDDADKGDDKGKEAEKSDAASKDSGEGEAGASGLSDLLGDEGGGEGGEAAGGEAGGEDMFSDSGEESKGEEGEEGGEAAAGPSPIDTQKEEKEKQRLLKKAAENAAETFTDVAGGAFDTRANRTLEKNIFDMSESVLKRSKRRLYETINKYVFRNVNLNNLNRNKLSLNKFMVNENNFFKQKVYKLLKESSLEDIINDKFWEENAAVDTLVDNALDLTRHFTDKIDIPALIINAVSVKFGKMAAEQEEPRYAEIFKQKLAEFISEYTRGISEEIPEYKNYPTDQFRLSNKQADIPAVGAKESS